MCSISWKRCRNTWMTGIVPFWKIFCHGQKNFRQESAKLKYWWLQSSRLKMSRYSLFCVYFDSNGGALYNYLIKNDYNKRYKIIWLLKNKTPENLPENVKCFKLYSPNIIKDYYICMAQYLTADCVITDKVRKDQKSYYFTHGAIGLKNVAGKCFVPETVDYILTPSEFYGPTHASQYELNYDPLRFISLGYPCQDTLFEESDKEIEKITLKKYSKLVLWMPTFRKGGGIQRNDSSEELPMGIPIVKNENMLEELDEWLRKRNMLLIIKIHPMQDMSTVKVHSTENIIVLTGETIKKLDVDNCRLMKDVDALISDYL